MNLTAPPATMMTPKDSNPARASIQSSPHLGSCRCRPFADYPPPARRATCVDASRSPGDIRVMPGGNATSRQIEKGTSDEKVSHTVRRRNRVVGCRPGHRHKLLRAVSHDTHWQSGNTHIATPTYGAGAIARPIQNGTMWNLYGLYRAPTGIYYSRRTGAMCLGQPSAACF
jgi:hypothetical protein